MGIAALGAEILKILGPLGVVHLILVLCRYVHAIWLSRRAFETGQPVWVKVKLHSLEFSIGAKGEVSNDSHPQEGGELENAVEAVVEAFDESVDDGMELRRPSTTRQTENFLSSLGLHSHQPERQ